MFSKFKHKSSHNITRYINLILSRTSFRYIYSPKFSCLKITFPALVLCLFASSFFHAQIFRWDNPNFRKDSISAGSVIAQKLNLDVFTRDTLDYIQLTPQPALDEGVRVAVAGKQALSQLNSKGSIIRGITFGNNQGQSVQSSMDLQISGRLSDDVTILASVSDHNLPIQADGYTQTLEEFDRIYLQLNIRDRSVLQGGHLELNDNTAHFARYQRRSMGLQYSTLFDNEHSTALNVSAGIARSEFFRIRFEAVEGNQGPYRLRGKNGEQFITVLSGSEQVYIDGILMKRGEDQDYVINYNTGEITFTSFRPIFRQNFITISYNYTNRNYTRFLVTGNISHKREKFQAVFNWFVENDSKNAPLALNLSKEDQQILAAAGNNSDKMYAPSGTVTEYDVNKILYELVTDVSETYYRYSTDESKTLYQVAFTQFGANNGDYILKQSIANGRVFEYVGSGMGSYRAVRKLPAPEKTHVYSANAVLQLNEGAVGGDVSLSNHDRNLFSSLDAEENLGYAARIFGYKTFHKGRWQGTPRFEYQHLSDRFYVLDRINDTEFARDFNLQEEFNNIRQDRLIFDFKNSWQQAGFLNYTLNYLTEKNFYKGLKNELAFGWTRNKWSAEGAASYLKTDGKELKTHYARGNTSVSYISRTGVWSSGGGFEENSRKLVSTGLLDAESFRWKEIFLQNKIADSARTKLLAKIYLRENDSARNDQLITLNQVLGIKAESQLIKTERTQLGVLLHYRKFFNKENSPSALYNRDYIIGNISYSQQFLNNGLRLQAFYELGNGQEARREFQYIKVTDGQGVYKWTDYNGDGIQQLDEFEIAEYADLAQYIRIYTNTITYVPSNKNKLELALYVQPSFIFNSENRFLKRWNLNLSVNSQNSYLKENDAVAWNPFEKNAAQLLKNQSLLVAVQFHSTDVSGWNGGYRFVATDNLINANYSNEERRQSSHFVNIGYWFGRSLKIDWQNSLQDTGNTSQLFDSRNFLIQSLESRPKATYQLSEHIQAEASAAVRHKNRQDGPENLKTYELTGTLQWERRKTSLRGNFSFINHDFTGNSFSIVGNQMLDGLKAGKNQVWSLFLQQSINSFLQLNVNYEGRNSGERIIHIGSMQLKAVF